MMKVAESLMHALKAYGAGEIFDIQGYLALPPDGRRVAMRIELANAAATRGRFQLIEVMIPGGAMSATLRRFIAGVKHLHSAKDAT